LRVAGVKINVSLSFLGPKLVVGKVSVSITEPTLVKGITRGFLLKLTAIILGDKIMGREITSTNL